MPVLHGNAQEIDGVVCSAAINEDINDSKSVTDPHNIRHSSAVNETSEADSQLPLKEQEEVISTLAPNTRKMCHSAVQFICSQ